MKAITNTLGALFVVLGVLGELSPPERSYKILMLLPVSSKSHRNVFMPVAEGLADRGHKVVMLVNHKPASKHPNVHEINHGLPYFNEDEINFFETRKNPMGALAVFKDILYLMGRDLYNVPAVIDLYNQRKEFDLIVVNQMFNEMVYPFAHEMPFITISTSGLDFRHSALMGNVLNPSFIPSFLKDFPQPMSMLHRLENLISQIGFTIYWRYWTIIPPLQAEISRQFPHLPQIFDIERNLSLTLMNSHFTLDAPVPLLPSQVEVGGMHCHPGKPLPQDLQGWIEGAGEVGVVYMSLGSVAKGKFMPTAYRDLFVEAFKQIQQRVIWKYEDKLEVSGNVMISNWLPQQDILAHPNVKVFISHGGGLSTQEAIYHATPILSVPIFGDQLKNGARIENAGFGKTLVWEELTVDIILKTLKEIIENPSYEKNLKETSASMKDQIDTPLERAVFWTEYVIRHNGAPRLRSPAAQLSWVKFLMLDVFGFFLAELLIIFYLIRFSLRALKRKLTGPSKKTKKE